MLSRADGLVTVPAPDGVAAGRTTVLRHMAVVDSGRRPIPSGWFVPCGVPRPRRSLRGTAYDAGDQHVHAGVTSGGCRLHSGHGARILRRLVHGVAREAGERAIRRRGVGEARRIDEAVVLPASETRTSLVGPESIRARSLGSAAIRFRMAVRCGRSRAAVAYCEAMVSPGSSSPGRRRQAAGAGRALAGQVPELSHMPWNHWPQTCEDRWGSRRVGSTMVGSGAPPAWSSVAAQRVRGWRRRARRPRIRDRPRQAMPSSATVVSTALLGRIGSGAERQVSKRVLPLRRVAVDADGVPVPVETIATPCQRAAPRTTFGCVGVQRSSSMAGRLPGMSTLSAARRRPVRWYQ